MGALWLLPVGMRIGAWSMGLACVVAHVAAWGWMSWGVSSAVSRKTNSVTDGMALSTLCTGAGWAARPNGREIDRLMGLLMRRG